MTKAKIISGIYEILNLKNGERYIGSAVDLRHRRSQHWGTLRKGIHRNSHLQRAWVRYGEETFEFRVVGTCPIEKLLVLEQYMLDHLNPHYNISPVAGSSLGIKRTDETRAKISAVRKGTTDSKETRRKKSMSMLGNTRRLGKPHSEKTRQKLRGRVPWNKGIKRSVIEQQNKSFQTLLPFPTDEARD
jgi:group I intron endonuclease